MNPINNSIFRAISFLEVPYPHELYTFTVDSNQEYRILINNVEVKAGG